MIWNLQPLKSKVAKVRGEPINNLHRGLGTYPLGNQINAGRMTNWPLYANSVIGGGMVA